MGAGATTRAIQVAICARGAPPTAILGGRGEPGANHDDSQSQETTAFFAWMPRIAAMVSQLMETPGSLETLWSDRRSLINAALAVGPRMLTPKRYAPDRVRPNAARQRRPGSVS
jgi:hypothetical protein